jgi:hypothetical protein
MVATIMGTGGSHDSAAGFKGVSLAEATIIKHRQAQAARQEAKRLVGEFDMAQKKAATALLKQQGRSWYDSSWEEKLAACLRVPAGTSLFEQMKKAAGKAAFLRQPPSRHGATPGTDLYASPLPHLPKLQLRMLQSRQSRVRVWSGNLQVPAQTTNQT